MRGSGHPANITPLAGAPYHSLNVFFQAGGSRLPGVLVCKEQSVPDSLPLGGTAAGQPVGDAGLPRRRPLLRAGGNQEGWAWEQAALLGGCGKSHFAWTLPFTCTRVDFPGTPGLCVHAFLPRNCSVSALPQEARLLSRKPALTPHPVPLGARAAPEMLLRSRTRQQCMFRGST